MGTQLDYQQTADFSGKVVRILDGDTLEVLHGKMPRRIRLAEIDCPQKGQPFGKGAKQMTAELAFSQTVLVRPRGRDRNGRNLGEIILPAGRNLGHELVKVGLAWRYLRYSRNKTLGALETEARTAKRGLWRDLDTIAPPVPPWKWHPGKGAAGGKK